MYSQGYPMMYGYGGGMGGGGMGMGMGGGIMSFFTFSKYFTSHWIVGNRKRSILTIGKRGLKIARNSVLIAICRQSGDKRQ